MNKILKVILIAVSSILAVLTLLVLLLSILFPRELVRKELEKAGSDYLKTQLIIEKLDFSIFSGLELNNVKVRNKENIWKNEYILNIKKLELKYSLFRLLKKELYIKAALLNGGEINLQKNKRSSNWDYFVNIFNQGNKKGNTALEKKDDPKTGKKSFNKSTLPVELNIKKAGLENINISYIDSSILKNEIIAKISNTDILVKNILAKENKPFDLVVKINLSAESSDVFKFAGNIRSDGKLKLFNEKNEFELNGPIDITIDKVSVKAAFFKNASSFIFENILSNILGDGIKSSLTDKNKNQLEVNNYFNGLFSDSKGNLDKAAAKAGEILNKKEDIIKFRNNIEKSFDDELIKSVSALDEKIVKIEKDTAPLIQVAERIPFIDRFVNISSYKEKVQNYKNEILLKKSALTAGAKGALKKEMDGKTAYINSISSFSKTNYEAELNKTINKYKNEISKNIGKMNIESLLKGFLPDLSFLDKEFSVRNIKTTYLLNRTENKAKDINFNSDFLNITGEYTEKNKNIDFTGDFIFSTDKLGFDLIPVKELGVRLNAAGTFTKLQYKIIDMPKLALDKEKIRALADETMKKYLGKYYSKDILNNEVLKKFSLNDFDENKVKESLTDIKERKLTVFQNEKNALGSEIDRGIERLVDELKGKVPGL